MLLICRFHLSLIILVFTIIGCSSSFSSELEESECYKLGYRYGRCAAKIMIGKTCKTSDNIVIPERCQYDPDTKRGMEDALKKYGNLK